MSSTVSAQTEVVTAITPVSLAQKPQFTIPTDGVKKVVLKNGMTVLVYPNKAIPKVLVQIAYNVGSYVENAGERGLAHLIEHMIFKGTSTLSETDIDAIARKYGATYNAFTSMDVTSYFFETNKNNWQPFMTILADCMQNARFDQQHLASELKAVIQELKMYKDNYWSMMIQKINALEYPANHPYHYPIIGYKEDLMHLSADNLKRFYKKYYRPDRATLFVVGDVGADEVIALAQANFESIVAENKKQDAETFFPDLPQNLQIHHTSFYEDIKTELLGFYWRMPGLKSKDEIFSTAAAFLLGGGEGSRMYRALVDERKVASSVMVFPYKSMESGLFLILIEPMPGKAATCREIVESELDRAFEDGFTDHELKHMVRAQGKNFFQKLEHFGSDFTYEWLTSYFASGNEYAIFNRVNKFSTINSEDVQNFIHDYLDPFLMNQIETLLMPDAKRAASERAKYLSDELDKKILTHYERTTSVELPRAVNECAEPKHLDFTFPKPDKEFILNNGLTVLLRANKVLPLISVRCMFREATYFSSAKEGIVVDLMMNMLMEESRGFTKKDNVDFFESYGAQYSFSTSGGSLSLLSADYKAIFERFAHVLLNPMFPVQALEKLKAISLDSLARSKDDPQQVGMRQLKNMVYKNHPFNWSFDDALELVKNSSVHDLAALHTLYVTPSNMVLAITGDFDNAEMEQVLRDIFEQWPQGCATAVTYTKSPFVAKETVTVPMVRDQVFLLMGQPSPINVYHPDLVPLKLLNYIGFHSLGSRIFQLRQQSGLFYTAFGGWAKGAGKESGFDFVGAIVNPENVELVRVQMHDLIRDMAEKGVTRDELESARQLYLKQLIDLVSTNGAVADLLASLSALNLGFDYYDNVLQRTQTIELAELNHICSAYFTADQMATVKVGRVDTSRSV